MTFLRLVPRVLYQVEIWLNFFERFASLSSFAGVGVIIQGVKLGQTEITNLKSLSSFIIEDVLRLDVSVDQSILMYVLQCGHQLSKHLQHLLPSERLFVHIISQGDPVCILHQYHDVQAHELFALFDQLIYACSAIAVWVIIFAAVNVISFWIVVAVIFTIAVLNLSPFFESNLKFLIEIVGQCQLRVIFVAFFNTVSDTSQPSTRFAELFDYFLYPLNIWLFSLNPATFVSNNVLVLEFAYCFDLFHSWVIVDRSVCFWVEFNVHPYGFKCVNTSI